MMFVMVKYSILFEVRTEFLNNIQKSFVLKGLKHIASKDGSLVLR
jgi:hypothetical protein